MSAGRGVAAERHSTGSMMAGAIALLLASSLLIGWMLYESRRSVRQNAENMADNIALTLEREIGRTIGAYDLSMRAAANGLALIDRAPVLPNLQQALLFDGAADAPFLGAIELIDEQGRPIFLSKSFAGPLPNLGDRPYFQSHKQDPNLGLQFTFVRNNRFSGEDLLLMTRRLNASDGSFRGIVGGSIKMAYFSSLSDSLHVGAGGVVSVLHLDGEVIFRAPRRPGDSPRAVPAAARMQRMREVGHDIYESTSTVDGIRRVVAVRRIGDLPLVVTAGLALDDIYADWGEKAAGIAGTMLILVSFAIILVSALRQELGNRQKAERRASVIAGELRAMSDNIDDLVLKIDWAGRRLFVSAACERMLGYAAAELIDGDSLALVHETDRPRLIAALASMRDEDVPVVIITYRIQHRNGAWRHFEARARVLPDHTGAIIVARDVTDRLSLEEQLRQAQRMEAVGRLSAGVAHDFNNLLQAQMGSLELLQDAIDRKDTVAATDFNATALRLAERGAYLTHHLLSFSRQQILRPRPVMIEELLGNAGQVLGRTLGPKVSVEVQVEPGTGGALVDPSLLETALLNLAFNARDAMPNGGRLRIEAYQAEHVTAETTDDRPVGRYVVVAVADDGIGMTPEVRARAMEPFYTTKGVHGSGLGLAMVHGFTRQSGGDVLIETEPGRGTRIELWLPASPEGGPLAGPPVPAVGRCAGRALVVDDAPDVLIAVCAFLESAGFVVSEAATGEAALARLQDGEVFDLLVTDFAMPGISGAELIVEAQAILPALPALVITGYAEETILESLPNVQVVRKPFRRDGLLRAIQTVMSANRQEVVSEHYSG